MHVNLLINIYMLFYIYIYISGRECHTSCLGFSHRSYSLWRWCNGDHTKLNKCWTCQWWPCHGHVRGVTLCIRISHLFPMNCFKDCSIIAWNMRGVVGCERKCHIRQMVRNYKPSLLLLFETHSSLGTDLGTILASFKRHKGTPEASGFYLVEDFSSTLVDSMPHAITTFTVKKSIMFCELAPQCMPHQFRSLVLSSGTIWSPWESTFKGHGWCLRTSMILFFPQRYLGAYFIPLEPLL